ncbi:DUF3298 and DUF4163 domain-containing protein [Metabacillus malikii]|uniref:DUF3298 domain-containing protein n=1 Tax=Metabacillus malikii TaxID=1504265 RepID=A0ABT9ZNV3_9BACI|nr:DUF3298 domain-containing protein [Metabacillus malikii]MDQ0233466.1 hypothetical protein [Metabacillus malikii]
MKYKITIMLSILLLLFISGCNKEKTTTEAESDDKTAVNEHEEIEEKTTPKLNGYETIKLEHLDDKKEVTIEYPKFSYRPLDEILKSENEALFNAQQSSLDEMYTSVEGLGDLKYFFTREFNNPVITDEFVSIYFEDYIYMGGAHGTPGSNAINYDLKNERLLTIHDVLKKHSTNLEVIAALVADKLIHDEKFADYRDEPVSEQYKQSVKGETMPTEGNFSTFTLTSDSIIFYNQYYSIFPNAAGIVDIEITWDEVQAYMKTNDEKLETESGNSSTVYEFGSPLKPMLTTAYTNKEYGFSLNLPKAWRGRYHVRVEESPTSFSSDTSSPSIIFSMVEKGKYVGSLFSINVLEDVSEEEVKAYYRGGSGFEDFLAADNDVVLIYSRPGQLPEQLYEEPYIELGNQFAKMVEEDIPQIIKTVRFN